MSQKNQGPINFIDEAQKNKLDRSHYRSYPQKLLNNIKSFRIRLMEISGSLGDMGTFIPLLVGMVSVNKDKAYEGVFSTTH